MYILNRRPRELDKKLSYELWSGKKTTLNHLRKFGAEAYVHVPKQFRSKFESKSKKMILVGYDRDSSNYRVFDPATSKITVTRDVVFNESKSNKNQDEESSYTTFTYETIDTQDVDAQIEKNIQEVIQEERCNIEEVENIDNNQELQGRVLRDRSALRPPTRYNDELNLACAAIVTGEPQTYKEAVSSEDAEKWEQAMAEEMASLKKNKTWNLEPLPPTRRAIDCKWVYKIKRKPDGSVDRYKARLCAKGYLQQKGIDYSETFAPVVRYDSVRVLLAIATINDMDIKQFDVKTAFLYGELTEEVFMKQPEGFVSVDPSLVCSLKKSLYGLRQSPRCWNGKFTEFLTEFNFTQLKADKCVFWAEYEGEEIFLALYVDDGLIMCKKREIINKILRELGSQFEIKVSDPECFVGLEIKRDRKAKKTFISQESYITRLMEKFNMQDCKPSAIPADPNTELTNDQSPKSEIEMEYMRKVPFREAIGSLMFAAIVSRPDIMFAVSQISRFLQNPGQKHWAAVKRILRYLQGTKDVGIVYNGDTSDLKMYADADFAGDVDSRRSTSGYISILANGPITWCSQRQKCVARSTTEAEYVAASNAAREIVWLRALLQELTGKMNEPTKLMMDNQSAIKLIKNAEHHKLTKHIDIKFHFIRECADNATLEAMYIPTHNQLADFLTKSLPRDKFKNNCTRLSIISLN